MDKMESKISESHVQNQQQQQQQQQNVMDPNPGVVTSITIATTMTTVSTCSNNTTGVKQKQKRLGPAPIASFEDISDEMESGSSPECRLPEIREHPNRPAAISTTSVTSTNPVITSGMSLGVNTPSTPRIDISRASSSSHHEDSRDSSPENVFEQIGTGTLQETGTIGLGFREDGTLELRSSTEELYFMEPEKGKTEREKPIQQQPQPQQQQQQQQQSRRSPVMFKFDEQQQTCLQQNQRKDSASSEVAALLSISGRTSRISSVGSQGSAASRLSAVSGVSRSPSPHRMLLETSFCGPKPLDTAGDGGVVTYVEPPSNRTLEQVILARKHDPTQAVLAEGIKIDISSPKKTPTSSDGTRSQVSNGTIIESTAKRKETKNPEVTITKAQNTTATRLTARKAILSKKDLPKPVLGVMPSGTEYIRIKLKPDHLYDDKGLAPNERVLDEPLSEVLKKPVTLSLGQDGASSRKMAPHFSQLVQADETISRHPDQKTLASPKPARHTALARDVGSRSPSPATITVSRKSSFCSLFKSKEASASPESPTVCHRKKSGISTLSKELEESPRDRSRSRSKSREREKPSPPQTSITPNKQKSVLAIFKPKRSGSKSKSSSPVDPDVRLDSLTQVEFQFKTETNSPASNQPPRPRSKLRYYDTPLDGKSIHIPLHTPPDEKEDSSDSLPNYTRASESTEPTFIVTCHSTILREPIIPVEEPEIKTESKQPTKIYRIENPDGSVRIPLHSPTEEKEHESTWNMEVQRHSSQESQETVISTHAVSVPSTENALPKSRKTSKPSLNETEPLEQIENGIRPSVVSPIEDPSLSAGPEQTQIPVPAPPPPTPASATIKDKRHILFTTKIGSGSEEQLFCTQLSLSKTESLSSQLSEQVSALDSPSALKDSLQRCETVIRKEEGTQKVVLRKKQDSSEEKRKLKSSQSNESIPEEQLAKINVTSEKQVNKEDAVININRHSMFIENIDEIMETQQKIHCKITKQKEIRQQSSEDSSLGQSSTTKRSNPVLDIPEPPKDRNSMISTDEPGGSSESERDSEVVDPNRVKRHLPRNIGVVDDHESAGLVSTDSFDEELPYVPTTLPEERSVGVSMIPIKERAHMELKTYPVERPRSTTPINPSCLEEYCGNIAIDELENTPQRAEKLKISLPRKDSRERNTKSKSPRRVSNTSGKTWFEFAEQGIKGQTASGSDSSRRNSGQDEDPPPLPPRKSQNTTQWINFENIPEKRKPPKRITTLPNKESATPDKTQSHHIQYNYVNPEECQCECHEIERDGSSGTAQLPEVEQTPAEDTQPLLEPELGECIDRTSISDSSMDYSYSGDAEHPATHHHHRPIEKREQNLTKPFGMDLSVGQASSNRSSVASPQESHSPESSSSPNTSTMRKKILTDIERNK